MMFCSGFSENLKLSAKVGCGELTCAKVPKRPDARKQSENLAKSIGSILTELYHRRLVSS